MLCICISAFLGLGTLSHAASPKEAEDQYQFIADYKLGNSAEEVAEDDSPGSLNQDGYIGADSIDNFDSPNLREREGSRGSISVEKSAAETDGDVLTLFQACELAIENHPLVESSRSSKIESAASYGIAKSVYYPRVDLQAQVGPSHDLRIGQTTYGQGTLSVTQKLYDFGGIGDGVDSARLKAVGAELRFARTKEDIAALVINSYFSILQAQELVNVYSNTLEFYEKLLATFWERYNAGISSKADSKKVEVSLRATQSQLTIQNQQLETARLLLQNIIKQPVDRVATDVGLVKVDIKNTLDESYAVALDNNVSLQAYAAEIASQQKVVSSNRSGYYPAFGYRLQAKNELQKIDGYKSTLDAQLTLNWNLFSGFATDEAIVKEEAVLRRMVATKQATELQIRNILSDAFNSYESSVKEFELAKEAYDSSVYLMGLYLSEFDLGIRTLLDLITAREGQTSAAVREVNARFARIRASLSIVLEEGRLAAVLKLPLDDSQ